MDDKTVPMARRSLALLLGLNLLCYLDRYILMAVEPEIRKEFLAPDDPNALAKMGWLSTAFLVSYMVTSPVFGWLSDRYSRWLIIAFGVAVWSVASTATGLAATFGIMMITRMFVGVGEAAYGPAAPTLLASMWPIERRGAILAWFFAAIPVGSALGYMYGGWISSIWGWRWAFYLVGVPGLLFAGLCLLMRDSQQTQSAVAKKPPRLSDYTALLKIPSYTINMLAQTAMTFAIGGMSFWAPAYFHDYRHLPNLAQINLIFGGITAVAGLSATLFGGWLSDRLTRRFPSAYFLVSAAGMLIAFPCTLLMLVLPFPLAWVAVFFAVFFLFFNIGPSNTALANVSAPAVRATAYALNILVIHALGDAISPPLIGAIADRWNLNIGFLVVSFSMLVAGMLWLWGARFLPEDTRKVAENF